MRGDAARAALGGTEGEVRQRALERAEAGAVDGVDDDGHARRVRGEAAQHAGLAAVGVDDVGSLFAEEAGELAQREPVVPRGDGADEFGDEGEQTGEGGDARFEAAFRAGGGAGEEGDFQAGLRAQAQHAGDGVLLRPADN